MAPITWFRLAVVTLSALVLQVALLDQIVVLGAHPDVMVLLPATAGLLAGPSRGAVVGFVAGLFADLVVQLPYGLSPLAFALAGFGAGMLATVPIGRDMPGAIGMSAAALGMATAVLYTLIGALVGQPGLLGVASVEAVIVVGLGGLLLAWPVLGAMRWCFNQTVDARAMPSGGSALSS